VVGILVSGAVDARGVSVGQQFLMPLEVLRDDLRTVNAAPATSLTTTVYRKALEDYFRGYYSRALPGFRQVKDLYPSHAYADKFISDSQTAITQGRDVTPEEDSGGSLLLYVAIGAAVLVLAGAIALLLMLRRRGRRAAPSAGPSGTPEPAGYAPAPGMPYAAAAHGAYAPAQGTPHVPTQGTPHVPMQGTPYAPAGPGMPYVPAGHGGSPQAWHASTAGAPTWQPLGFTPEPPASTVPADRQ
jgi:hypothetical protein